MNVVWALVLGGTANAGLIDALDDPSRHLAYCKEAADSAAEAHRYKEAAGAWDACAAEAERRGYRDLLPGLQAQVAVSRAMADGADYRLKDPAKFAVHVLEVAARQSALDYPSDALRELFRGWMETDEGRAKVSSLRTVTVDWRGGDKAQLTRASEVVRRYIEDVGLKWADPGSPDVDVILFSRLMVTTLSPTEERQGAMQHSEVKIITERVRFKTVDKEAKGFTAESTTESPDADQAEDKALHTAAELAARATLQRVLTQLFPLE